MIFQNPEYLKELAEQAELIEKLLDIGASLSSTQSLSSLLNLILSKSREITYSDAGSVYLVDNSDNTPKLLFKVAQNVSLPNVSFREFAIPLTERSLAGYVALTGETLNIPDAYQLPPDKSYRLDSSFDRDISYRTRSVLVLPMQNRQGETIGVLQLINRKIRPDVTLVPENTLEMTQSYGEWEERILRSLASQAAISIERNHLQESIEYLFEGFVKASVQVIEQRDPSTFGHSERVAQLTVRLAEEVNTATTGSLADITFSDRQIQEIRYAALLHDFGKIGIPEAILTKSKKLYPHQLEVLRQRFTLARRTLEWECTQAKCELLLQNQKQTHSESSVHQKIEQLEANLNQELQQLTDYWNLLLQANEPQVTEEEPLKRLSELTQIVYRDIDGEMKPLVTPEEMSQLLVKQGNLTQNERLVIESHVTHTYKFLEKIPWTKDLQNVPQIAYGHHEKLDGTGYPLGLKQEKIPIQAQIMAIADIYDALTAGDKPYKHALPTVTALKILRKEADQNKVNPDILELFEKRQVYQVIGHSLDVVMKLA
ncbi:HD-GYP domain-containing protein [Limnoraphis robusta]|uniref:HD domain-containing phosphohydrolase n=1 Tax=Limnoraphis robusta CCNP1315 TaxID=3110306 RepID=A0ABU5U8W7_9CYAN|nr:HD domain-containing phosphohydrolase [Limnoraphis robusta]MEA5523287.1 HD domain-containing phosphohydrolase [Limnoraphis robusta CCNP1315]MEA5544411.1 HD domain-containing phosphohydrolase [Limnoraphis robusta CCNP1324]